MTGVPESQSRRTALRALAGLVAGGVASSFLYPAWRYLFHARAGGPIPEVNAGSADDYQPGTWKLLRRGDKPALVVRLPDGTLRAWSAVCPHLGCTVGYNRETNRVFCGCHSAAFDPASGEPLAGPTRNPLTPIPYRETDAGLILAGGPPEAARG